MRESNVVRRAKKRARTMSQGEGSPTHQQALDMIAAEEGHPHWAAMLAANPPGRIDADRGPAVVQASGARAEDVGERPGIALLRPDAFASEWLHLAMRAGETVRHHLMAVADFVVGDARSGSVPARDLTALIMAAHVAEHGEGGMDAEAIRTEAMERIRAATMSCRAAREDQAASKQLPTATVLSILVDRLASDAGDLGGPMADRLSSMRLTEQTERMVVELVVEAVRGGGRVGEHRMSPMPGGVGVADLMLFMEVSPIPLMEDERRIVIEALDADSPGLPCAATVLGRIRHRSPGIQAAHDASRLLGLVDPKVLSRLVSVDLRAFPTMEGRLDGVFDSIAPGLRRMSDDRRIFSRWMSDAVEKARRGVVPFRYDPLAGTVRPGSPGGDRALDDLSASMADLGSDAEGPPPMAVAAFSALASLTGCGIANSTIQEICPGREAPSMRMSTILAVHDSMFSMGPDQVLLYATLNGLPSEHGPGLEAMFDPEVSIVIHRALLPFRHPAIAAAC